MKKTMKKIILVSILTMFAGCAQLTDVVNQLPEGTLSNLPSLLNSSELSNDVIASGLREALDQGIERQVSKLTQEDGYFKNELVKILLPDELKQVDSGLRKLGLSSLADKGLEVLNRAAENAVSESTPIFIDAVKEITFADAKNILLGSDNAATTYLNGKTNSALYLKFSPVVKRSLSKVGADSIWSSIISKYNALPFANKVNPDLTDYVSQQALSGVFKMISIEEANIRTQLSFRNTDLLKKVFALQD